MAVCTYRARGIESLSSTLFHEVALLTSLRGSMTSRVHERLKFTMCPGFVVVSKPNQLTW